VQVRHYARLGEVSRRSIPTLKAVFRWFHKLKLIEGNPLENVAAPELDRHEVK
jgi:hypothetical protein